MAHEWRMASSCLCVLVEFIQLIASEAAEQCQTGKRQLITKDHIEQALTSLELPEYSNCLGGEAMQHNTKPAKRVRY